MKHIDQLTKSQREQIVVNAIAMFDYFRGIVSDMEEGSFNMIAYRQELPAMKAQLLRARDALKPLWEGTTATPTAREERR